MLIVEATYKRGRWKSEKLREFVIYRFGLRTFVSKWNSRTVLGKGVVVGRRHPTVGSPTKDDTSDDDATVYDIRTRSSILLHCRDSDVCCTVREHIFFGKNGW